MSDQLTAFLQHLLNYRTTHCIQVYFLRIAPFAEGWQRYLSLEASGGDAPAVMMNIDYKQKLFPHARAEDETRRAPTTPLSLPKYGQRPRARGDRKKSSHSVGLVQLLGYSILALCPSLSDQLYVCSRPHLPPSLSG